MIFLPWSSQLHVHFWISWCKHQCHPCQFSDLVVGASCLELPNHGNNRSINITGLNNRESLLLLALQHIGSVLSNPWRHSTTLIKWKYRSRTLLQTYGNLSPMHCDCTAPVKDSELHGRLMLFERGYNGLSMTDDCRVIAIQMCLCCTMWMLWSINLKCQTFVPRRKGGSSGHLLQEQFIVLTLANGLLEKFMLAWHSLNDD